MKCPIDGLTMKRKQTSTDPESILRICLSSCVLDVAMQTYKKPTTTAQ